jgi:hypothetical protein
VSRKEYSRAEGRLKRSIALRREGLPHDYAGRDDDLQTMKAHHSRLGEIPPERGFYAYWRRFFGRQGRGGAS